MNVVGPLAEMTTAEPASGGSPDPRAALWRRALAEFVGTALRGAAVIGSGIPVLLLLRDYLMGHPRDTASPWAHLRVNDPAMQ